MLQGTGSAGLLRMVLLVTSAAFFLIYPMSILWPSGWSWHEANPAANNYFLMIVGVYATLGLFLFRASKDPLAHASLIWFTVWSSVVHALVMALEALATPGQHAHLYGDVPALLLVALLIGFLMRRAQAEARA